MPTVKALLPTKRRMVKQQVNKDLYWYDTEKQSMFKGNGSYLSFDYKLDDSLDEPKYRLLPRVVHASETVFIKSKDKNDVLSWWKGYQYENDSNAEILFGYLKDDSAIFEVPDDELDDFIYSLQSTGAKCMVI